MTKNDKVNVTVYVDSTSIREVASGFSGIIEGVGQLSENLKTIVREWQALTAVLPEGFKGLPQAGLNAMQAMIRGGASSAPQVVISRMTEPLSSIFDNVQKVSHI